jgi:chaperonin GroES
MTFTPILDRILVEPGETLDKTSGGIIIPDTAKEKPQKGTVIAVGPGKFNDHMTLKQGDSILYGKYTGVLIDGELIGDPGKEYLIMKESDVFAGLDHE